MLRPAEPLGFVGAVRGGDAPLGHVSRRLLGSYLGRFHGGADRHETGLALDHHVAGIGRCRGDEGDASGPPGLRQVANPLGAGPGLARCRAGQCEERPPVAFWRSLRRSSPRVLAA